MKGVVMAGGPNTRLHPLTRGVPKCLLPIYNQTMIDCCLEALKKAGVTEVLIVVDRAFVGNFVLHLGSSNKNGLKSLEYTTTPTHWGIISAIREVKEFVGREDFCLLFGDNIFSNSIENEANNFRRQKGGARVILAKVDNPKEYGIASVQRGRLKKNH
jgi:glucose-1-phosphate thymidylyltransferase